MDPKESEENPVFPIDISIFRENAQQNLYSILDSLPKEQKTLVLEKSCIPQLNYITPLEPLKDRRVNTKVILQLKPGNSLIVDSPIILYIIPPKLECIQTIQKHIEGNLRMKNDNETIEGENSNNEKEYHIIFIPKISNECHDFIINSNFCAYFQIHNLNIDIYPLDYELMSLENKNAFYELYVADNYTSLTLLANAIIKYETIFGKIKNKYYKGRLAKFLNEIINKKEEAINLDDEPNTLACFIFDRNVDMITPFCTQQIYEGLLDDFIGINLNTMKVDPKLLEKDDKKEIKLDLSNNEKFYTKIKDYNFYKIKSYLPNRLKEHNAIIEETKKSTRDIQKIQEDLENMELIKNERAALTNHINLTYFISKHEKLPLTKFYYNFEQGLLFGDIPDKIHDFIQNEICKKSDEYQILKIICLESLIHGGFKNKIYELIRKEFLNVYGFQEMFLWKNLEKIGVLKTDNSSFYHDVNKKLNLMLEEIDRNEQKDAAYTYSGYCPIFIRLLENAVKTGWGSIRDVLKKIPGEFEFPNDENEITSQSNETQFILLVFIGGLTYGELAAIRYLNKKFRHKKFIVLTNCMINAKKIFDSLKQGKFLYLPNEPPMNEQKFTFKNVMDQNN